MKIKILKAVVVFVLLLFSIVENVNAYKGDITHPILNNKAVSQSKLDDILKNHIGFEDGDEQLFMKKSVTKWIEDGGEKEDAGNRPLRHFHDPLEEWSDAGLWDNESQIIWALFYDEDPWSKSNLYSWAGARVYFYKALLGKEPSSATSGYYYAKMFLSLGQVMHLLSDASVPSHVRNDPHPPYFNSIFKQKDIYEAWAAKHYNDGIVKYEEDSVETSIFNNTDVDQTDEDYEDWWNNPITALWDQNEYDGTNPEDTWDNDLGLAEFTNANFFSQDTIPGEYSYPDPNSTANIYVVVAEDGKQENVYYIEHPDEGYRLATYSFINQYYYGASWSYANYTLDDNVCEDYAAELIPRAVGYSAALLDYFFRGDFDTSEVAFVRNDDAEMTGVDLKVENASRLSDDSDVLEALGPGEITIVCKYIPPGEDEYEYSVDENACTLNESGEVEGQSGGSINDGPVSVSAVFDEPVPVGATDISLTIVFRGKMGNETDAVAARVVSPTSRIAFSEIGDDGLYTVYTIQPDGSDIVQITETVEEPNHYYSSVNWSQDGRYLAITTESCTGDSADGSIDFCANEDYDRQLYILDAYSEATFPDNVTTILNGKDTDCPNDDDSDSYITLELCSFSPDSTQVVSIGAYDIATLSALVVFDLSTGAGSFINGLDYWKFDHINGSVPAWSPQGDAIAFCYYDRRFTPPANIYLISPDGGDITQLTEGDYATFEPSWSPDGEKIVFTSNRDGDGIMDIWVMDRDGGNKQNLFNDDTNCYQPSFSPDGGQIAFLAGGDVYIINSDGTGVPFNVTNSGAVVSFSWSPYLFETEKKTDVEEE